MSTIIIIIIATIYFRELTILSFNSKVQQHANKMNPSLVLLIITLSFISADPPLGKLELIQVLFRNGERTPYPYESYPLDPYASARHNPSAIGHLTELGRWRAHRLGRALRLHYEDQLKLPKWPEDVYAYSANIESCQETMRHVLEALYNADKRIVQQVHVRTLPREADVLMNTRQCSRFKIEADRVRRSNEVQKMHVKYEGLYRYLKDKTGLNLDTLNIDESLFNLYNLLESQSSMNLTLPDWCPEGVYNLLQEITFLHHELESHNDELKRLNGGPILRRFLDSMKRQTSRSHVHLYSAEGRNVAALARAMNKSYPRVPTFGSAIILEKRRDRGRSFVRIVIWTGNIEKIFPLQLKDCAEMCPMEEFVRKVQASIPLDDDMRCLLDDLKNRS